MLYFLIFWFLQVLNTPMSTMTPTMETMVEGRERWTVMIPTVLRMTAKEMADAKI